MLGSLWVSWTFLSMSPCFSWVCLGARLCLWSWRLAQTCCYVGFYGGKKKHMGCQTWKSIKKGEEGRGGGWWGEYGVEKKCDPRVLWKWNLDFAPLLPLLNCSWLFLSSQACKVIHVSLTEVCFWQRWFLTLKPSWNVQWCGNQIRVHPWSITEVL